MYIAQKAAVKQICDLPKMGLKMQEIGFWEPRFSKISGGACPRTPLVSKIWGSTNTPI